jgi:hypothetical protein
MLLFSQETQNAKVNNLLGDLEFACKLWILISQVNNVFFDTLTYYTKYSDLFGDI